MIKILKNISLAPLTTFGIGGKAKFFTEVGSAEELTKATKFAKDNELAVFVLGGGSNILISDDGFEGVVIKMNIRGLWITDIVPMAPTKSRVLDRVGTKPSRILDRIGTSRLSTGSDLKKIPKNSILLTVGAGEVWDDVVAGAVERGFGGIENLSLIPGTVGGAVYQNIGAYGAEIKDILTSVKAYDVKTGNVVELSNKECGFEYRSSVFKEKRDLIVLEAELMLSKENEPNLSYLDLQKRFAGAEPTIAEIRKAVIEIRRSNIPYPEDVGNAGSFFKNPVIKISNFEFLISKHPDLKGRDLGNGFVKLSAAQLIEKAGFKGKRVGNVGVSDKHALVLVNYGGGTAKELVALETAVGATVEDKFGVKLEPEVEKVA